MIVLNLLKVTEYVVNLLKIANDVIVITIQFFVNDITILFFCCR